jgi:prepilin-type N-terminal cleavage/methylation domain-containing protein
MRSTSKNKRSYGFTLVEILVATAMMAILLTVVLSITNNFMKGWNQTSGKLSTSSDAKLALDYLSRDLSSAIFRNDQSEWLETQLNKNVGPNPYLVRNTSLVNFFTPVVDESGSTTGDISAVCYELESQTFFEGSDISTFGLYRTLVSPQDTFNDFLGDGSILSSNWGSSSAPYNPYTKEKPPTANLIVANVVEFTVLFGYTDTDGEKVEIPKKISEAVDLFFPENGTAKYVEITITVVTDEGAKLLNAALSNPPKWRADLNEDGKEDLMDIIDYHGATFRQRVYFYNKPI